MLCVHAYTHFIEGGCTDGVYSSTDETSSVLCTLGVFFTCTCIRESVDSLCRDGTDAPIA